MHWDVYRRDQVVPVMRRRQQPPRKVAILLAVWTANRTAKRYRDAASACYKSRKHSFASMYRQKKEELYTLKGQALHYLLEEGVVHVVGLHRFEGGNWAEVVAGDGYRFHYPCADPDDPPDSTCDKIESEPKGSNEAKLKDAIFTIEMYLEGRPVVENYSWPSRVRATRRIEDADWGDVESEDWDSEMDEDLDYDNEEQGYNQYWCE
jgi:hypothetical protein